MRVPLPLLIVCIVPTGSFAGEFVCPIAQSFDCTTEGCVTSEPSVAHEFDDNSMTFQVCDGDGCTDSELTISLQGDLLRLHTETETQLILLNSDTSGYLFAEPTEEGIRVLIGECD